MYNILKKKVILLGYLSLSIINIFMIFFYLRLHSIFFASFVLYYGLIMKYIYDNQHNSIVKYEDESYFIYEYYIQVICDKQSNLRFIIFITTFLLFIGSYIIPFIFNKYIFFSSLESSICAINIFVFVFASLTILYDDIIISIFKCRNITITSCEEIEKINTQSNNICII